MRPEVKLLTRCVALVIAAAFLASCGSNRSRDSAPSGSASIPDMPGNAVPRPEPRSRYGNGPVYEVFGKRYRVMGSGAGYSERGVASWYGKKFHGRLTSNREPYDMYEMTAAHKTLPLPTFVRVRNLRNNKSIVVRVNDRGPFVNNRIIDLSYAAALKLDMVGDGTSLVEVEAITFDEPSGDQPARTVTASASRAPLEQHSAPTDPVVLPRETAEQRPEPVDLVVTQQVPATEPEPAEATSAAQSIGDELSTVYVQVGAFGSRDNAERRLKTLSTRGISNSFIFPDTEVSPVMYRVRIGPIVEVIQYDVLVEELENLGISDPYLITE